MNRAEAYRKSKSHLVAYFVTLSVAVVLMAASFVLPPKGVVDPTVLQASALLLAFYCAFDLPHLIISMKTFKVSKGDLTFEGSTRKKEGEDAENVAGVG